ncbi:MAG: exopolysaccharide biosynthesis polyprenyl glycosylphosphotransferase, partial [Caldilineae bacterium]
FQRAVKRTFDIVVGSITLLFALPVMAVVALAIKLDSPGPIFFVQDRVGEGGRLFKMLKFRSMVADADARREEVITQTEDGQLLHKHADDPRITRVGKFIRRTSLDELPQLFNVIKGDMSLVGPRPEMPWLVELYEPWQYKRFAVPQGITGWWQVNGRSDKPLHLHIEEDLYYIQHYSLLLDVLILWKTLAAVVKKSGAY